MAWRSIERTRLTVIAGRRRLSDLAYDRILEALFDRRVSAGAFVSQGELSELVGVPVAPLRDALRVLEAEGMLTIHPRSGIQFVKPGLELTALDLPVPRRSSSAPRCASLPKTADEEEIAQIDAAAPWR